MKRASVVGLVAALCVLGQLPAARAGSSVGSYIVVLKAGSGDPGAVAAEHARSQGAQVSFVYRHALRGYAAAIPNDRVMSVRRDNRVAYVTADQPVQALGHTTGNAPTGVHRASAPDNSNIGIDGIDDLRADVDIAVIDTGIDLDHPDLNVVGGKNCQKGSTYDDGNGHGTHVAGTAAGLDRGSGAVGMAPGARLWAVRVLDNSGRGSWSSVLCGVDWVTAQNTDLSASNNIEVANMSLGGSGSEPSGAGCSTGNAFHDGICNSVAAGATYAVAAGNETDDAANHVPAAYDEVITVSALADFDGVAGGAGSPTCRTDGDDTFANFSNYGADVDIIAPGVCIRSTWKGGGYNTISGTSMASPHVAGAAALYKATHPLATPADVKAGLQSTGNLGWNASDDHDPVQEVLLDVHDELVFDPATTAGPETPPVNAAPSATFTSACTDFSCNFDASDSSDGDGSISSYEWDFGDTGTASGATTSHTYLAAGTYNVTLTIADDDGAPATSSQSVTVPNAAPASSFTFSCTDAACDFDGSSSSDSDGTVSSYEWDFGDGASATGSTVSHTYAAAGTYNVTLTITDSGGAVASSNQSVSVSAPPEPFSLSANGYKVKGAQKADLSWSGATSTNVDVYRDGVEIVTTLNDGAETDHIDKKGGGSYTYKVCESGTSTCSNEVTVSF